MIARHAFQLHPQLEQDTVSIGRFALCRVLLMNESRYPWVILVPERPDVREIYALPESDQLQLMRESSALAGHLDRIFAADKINIAAIGNVVQQLHLHHVVRFRHDAAWPAPVWGRFAPQPYTEAALDRMMAALQLAELPGLIRTAIA